MHEEAPIEAAGTPVEPAPRAVEHEFGASPVVPPRPYLGPIEEKLAAIEVEAEKWLGGRAGNIKRHVAALRELLQ